jgi:hypothetical protein
VAGGSPDRALARASAAARRSSGLLPLDSMRPNLVVSAPPDG